MKSESDFKTAILQNLTRNAYIQPLEAHGQPGVPDLLYTIRGFVIGGKPYGSTGLIELKFSSVRHPAYLRPSQKRFMERCLHHGGSPMVWTATKTGVFIHSNETIPFLLTDKWTHLEWLQSACDSIPINHPRLWEILEAWMIRPKGDGRSIWDSKRQGD